MSGTQVRVASRRLRPYVARLYGYEHTGLEPGVHLGLPLGWMTVVVDLADGLELEEPDLHTGPRRFDAAASGLYAGAVRIHYGTRQIGIQLDVTPPGSRALLGVPAVELAGTTVDLTELLGGRLELAWRERLLDEPDWPRRLALMDRLLCERLDARAAGTSGATDGEDEIARAIWELALAESGTLTVASLAERLGWSVRHVNAVCVREFGVAPKTLLSQLRFAAARRLVRERHRLSDVAADVGYTDQSHLAREWRRLVGMSPSMWLRDDAFAIPHDPIPTTDDAAGD